MRLRAVTTLLFTLALILPASSFAVDVQPGIDAVEHIPPTIWDFGPKPIDGDFFGPGSDPFDGGVPADQTSLDPTPDCPGASGDISMLIERLDTAVLPVVGSSDVIDVRIIAMSLESSSPITVTYGGVNPEYWMMKITPSPLTSSDGVMTIHLDLPDAGVFDSEILLQPYFTFTRVSDGEVRTLDGAGTYQDLISVTGVPWVYGDPGLACPPCASNFIPGHNGTSKVPYTYTGTMSQHTVRSSCLPAAIPVLSGWGAAVVLLLMLVLGVFSISRVRRSIVKRES